MVSTNVCIGLFCLWLTEVSLLSVSLVWWSVLDVSSTSYWETLLALVSLISPPSQQAKLQLCTGYGKCIAMVTFAVLEGEGPQRMRYPPQLPGDHMGNYDSQHGPTLISTNQDLFEHKLNVLHLCTWYRCTMHWFLPWYVGGIGYAHNLSQKSLSVYMQRWPGELQELPCYPVALLQDAMPPPALAYTCETWHREGHKIYKW